MSDGLDVRVRVVVRLACAVLAAMPASDGLEGQDREGLEPEARALLDAVRTEAESPGAILGLRFPDGRTVTVASGLADLDTRRPIRVTDAYFLGSISKTYTAVIALGLVERELLSLDDPLSEYLPSFPRGGEVSVRQLLSHTSGLKDFYSYLYYRPDRDEMIDLVTRDWSREELLELSARFGYWFDPGTDWSYSSTNYFLLGVLIEHVTGVSLPRAHHRAILDPLGLERTWLTFHEPAPVPLEITGHMGLVEGWAHSEMFGDLGATTILDRSPVEWGAGGLAATVTDALGFLDALMSGRLLTPESLQAMTGFRSTAALGRPDTDTAGADRPDGYGLGLVRMERPGFTLVGHGGSFTGHTAGLWHIRECGLTIALYFNRGFVDQRAALDRILDRLPVVFPQTEACRR